MANLKPMRIHLPTEAARTAHLSAEEYGAFSRLRMHRWVHGSIPIDTARQALIVRTSASEWDRLRGAVMPLFEEKGGAA